MSEFLMTIRDFNMQWTFVVCSMFLLWCATTIRRDFGAIPAALLAYCGLSASWVWVFSANRYVTINPYDQMALKYFAADSIAKLLILLLPVIALAQNEFRMRMLGEVACYLFVLFNSFWVALAFAFGCYSYTNACGGIIGNPSIGIGMMACTLPIFIHSWRKQWKILSLAALCAFASKSSVAIGIFFLYGVFWLTPWDRLHQDFRAWIFKALAFGAATLGAARLALGSEFTNDSDRFLIWKFMMSKWATPWNIPTGTGLGTYHVFSINLQKYGQEHAQGNLGMGYWWNTLHNEPLQFLFECGVFGFLLFLMTYFLALKRGFEKDPRVALSVLLFGAYMTLDPALHNAFPALFGAWLFVYALKQQNHSKEML